MFFQNVFDQEFRGTLLGADRQYSQNYNIKANINRSDLMMAFNPEPYDLSTNNTLTLNYAMDFSRPNFASLSINVAGTVSATTRAYEVVQSLNSDAVFSALFTATISSINGQDTVLIRSIKPKTVIRAFISNTSAEKSLKFNKKAPVAELPAYFERYTLANTFNYPDLGGGILIKLDPNSSDDQAVITSYGLDYNALQADWQLLGGRSDAFRTIKKGYTSGNLTSEIMYFTGAKAGDLAKKTVYTFVASALMSQMEIPYVLTNADLVTL